VSGRALLAALVEGRMDPATMSCPWAVTLLDTILGVDQRDGELMVAEGALPWRGLATRTAWRPGVAWRRATTKAPASRARDRPARATARGGRLQATGLCGGPHQRHVPLGRGSPTGRAPGENRAIMAVADSIVVRAFHRRSRHDPSRVLRPPMLLSLSITISSTTGPDGWRTLGIMSNSHPCHRHSMKYQEWTRQRSA
jgi:hypothetical protein